MILALPLSFAVPRLQYLNARVDALHAHLCNVSLTAEQRYNCSWELVSCLLERYEEGCDL